MAKRIQFVDTATGAKAQDVEYFASDIVINETATLTLSLSGTAVDVQVTLDSGSTWVDLITALVLNTHTEVSFTVRGIDTVNFRTNNASGITLDYLRVFKETA